MNGVEDHPLDGLLNLLGCAIESLDEAAGCFESHSSSSRWLLARGDAIYDYAAGLRKEAGLDAPDERETQQDMAERKICERVRRNHTKRRQPRCEGLNGEGEQCRNTRTPGTPSCHHQGAELVADFTLDWDTAA